MNRLRNLLVCLGPALLLAAGQARAQTAVWSDNFETNAAGHWSANSVWHIGSPTAGPAVNGDGFRAHSGATCAYTENYHANTDARTICSFYNGSNTLVVPPAEQSPRLRFWHWFNLANALGFVEISTNQGSTWTQFSPTYQSITSGGVWSRPDIDLSAYAGQSVQFALRFYGSSSGGNALGWYVDDMEVDTGAPALNFPESFEFDPKMTDWAVDFGTWEIGRPTSGPNRAHTGTNCAGTVLAGNYPFYADTRLMSPPFAVPTTGSATLRFWQWYSFSTALGFVEVNDGFDTVTSVTNTTIITNGTGTLNTNIYELFGAAIPGYATNFYWNPTIGGWTNGTKAMGNVLDFNFSPYRFDAGDAPLATVGSGGLVDYRGSILPFPVSAAATNFLAWQGMIWNSPINGSDNPVGYFATNYNYTYTTNATVVTGSTVWNQVSPTFQNTSTHNTWVQQAVDLSAYAGKTVQIAFHFGSGAGSAAGWYVDDLSLAAPPELFVPTNIVMYSGELLSVTNYASNNLFPNAQYTFTLSSPPPHVAITTNGMITWQTSPNQPSSTNTITVVVTDNDVPPLSATNSFTVTVVNPFVLTVPPTQIIYAGQTLLVTNYATNALGPDDTFTFTLLSPVLTNMDLSDLTYDGVISWPTAITQPAKTYTNIIVATDNDLPAYSATNHFLVIVSKTPPPVLTVPTNLTIYAGQILTVTNKATSVVFPDGTFTFNLLSDPTGIDQSDFPVDGVLVWTSNPTNKASTKTITIMVTDDQSELSATNNIKVTVLPTPVPSLILPAALTNYPGQQLAVNISATNVALPNAVYTFALTASSTNFFITNNSDSSAVLTWTNTGIRNGILYWTNNSVSPRTNTINVWVQGDTADWTSRATNHFALVFLPPPPPYLNPPTNPAFYVGQTFTNVLSATNDFLPGTNFTFALTAVLTNGVLKTNMLIWTNAAVLPGVYPVYVKITDDSVPPLRTTNKLSVMVLPFPSQLAITNVISTANGGKNLFQFSIKTPWTNTTWRIEATTNLDASDADWLPIFTNKTAPGGTLMFTDLLATNFLQRYYRVVFP